MAARGIVYLVGAGPGGAEYLTQQAWQALSRATVVIYDALIDSGVLAVLPPHAKMIAVGKRGGQPSTEQTQINQLLIDHCRRGETVIRLKSGDPFIFGRAMAEIDALRQADCPYQVIPGLSAALAAPLLAGIPLTDALVGRSFTVATVHEPESLDWALLAQMETLVLLMGGQHLAEIVQRLLDQGRAKTEAIAIIRAAGTPRQQVWCATLADICDRVAGQSLSPAVMVIGRVVNLRQTNSKQPLAGKCILVTRAADQASEFSQMLHSHGATVLEMPTLEIVPPTSWVALDEAISHLDQFHWLILTSANAVEYFWQRLRHNNLDARALANCQIAVVGNKTAQALAKYGLIPDFIPSRFVGDALVAEFPQAVAGLSLLFPRVESGGREVVTKQFLAQGARVIEVAAYQSRCPEHMPPQVWQAWQNQNIDLVTFTSSKTVQYFHQILSRQMQKSMMNDHSRRQELDSARRVLFAAIGPQTAQSCHLLLGRCEIQAQEYTLAGLSDAIVHYYHSSISSICLNP